MRIYLLVLTEWTFRRRVVGFLAALAILAVASRPGLAQDDNALMSRTGPRVEPPARDRTAFPLSSRPDVLDLESSLQRADLVMAARLVEVTESRVIQGGRNVQITHQYHFEPVRVIKGIYTREAFLVTGTDLGVYQFAAAGDQLQPGQILLILLARQGQNLLNCNPAATLGQSIPRLTGADDPLLSSVDVLLATARQRDRGIRARVLLEGLSKTRGREAGPLLLAILRRASIVARNTSLHQEANAPEKRESVVGHAILPFLKSDQASLRELAAVTIAAILDATPRKPVEKGRLPGDSSPTLLQVESARALDAALEHAGPDLASRVAMIEARGSTGGEWVGLTEAQQKQQRESPLPKFLSIAEATARYRSLAMYPPSWRKVEVVRQYQELLLDSPADFPSAVGRALVAIDPSNAADFISRRLVQKDDAGLDVSSEIDLIAELPAATAAPALLKAWDRSLNAMERLGFARACLKVPDPRLVPALGTLLNPREFQVRLLAVDALRLINTNEAASVLRLHLDEENDLSRKLQIIAFLARHEIHDGDSLALESLADANLREEAIDAVVAAGGPKTLAELQRIWRSSNDPTSNAAAFRALARLGQQDIAPRLLEIANTVGDPLAAPALLALADLGTVEAIPIVARALNSRRDVVVLNAARAGVILLKKGNGKGDPVLDRLAALLADADASTETRTVALDALLILNDKRLLAALNTAASDVNLEGTPLLGRIEAALETRPENP